MSVPIIQGEIPYGIQFINKINRVFCPRRKFNKVLWYKISIIVLTYMSYACFHMTRKVMSVVKPVLKPDNCSAFIPLPGQDASDPNWCDWKPFDGDNAKTLFGLLDSSFLFAYAFAMFFSGLIAERVNLRYFLSLGMIFSGMFCYIFGLAKTLDIHSLTFFIFVQIAGGIAQTTGWPGVVTIMSKWFGKNKRGLLMGIWNSHTSLGNIVGSVLPGMFLETDWSLSFFVPGLVIALGGLIIFLFLVVEPSDVGCTVTNPNNSSAYRRIPSRALSDSSSETDDTDILIGEQEENGRIYEVDPIVQTNTSQEKAIGFMGACKIPGVIEYSLCLFFAKLVSYTFLYWLPVYIQKSNHGYGPTVSADLSTLFDCGGIVGAILAGLLSDYIGMNALTCAVMLVLAVPVLFLYQLIGASSLGINIVLLLLSGVLVNGPYALITTAVSTELGTHSSVEGKAMATVTAIIDGTGSIGAAVGPLLAGVVSNSGWNNVFYILMSSNILALLLLSRLVVNEIKRYRLQSSSEDRDR